MIVYADISAFQAGIDVGALPGPVLVARVASYVRARIAAGTFLDGQWPRHRDNPAGWAPLGPAAVGALQYTDREPHGGYNIDMNAFPSSADELLSLLGTSNSNTTSRRRKILLLND